MGAKPRVVYVDHVAQLSGAELALLRLLPSVKGIAAHVILAEDGPLVARLRAKGISCEVLAMNPRTGELRKDTVRSGLPLLAVLDTLRYSFRLAKRLRQLDADLVHTNSMKAHLYGGIAARLAGVPQVWHSRDRISPDYLPMPAVRLMRLAMRHLPAALIANSRATLQTHEFRGGPRIVLPSPVLISSSDGTGGDELRSHDGFTVGLLGRLAPWKGQDLFLRAFAGAFPDGQEQAVIIGSAMFGEAEFAATLPPLAAQLGIADRVEFAGFVEDAATKLGRFDVLVHCSVVAEPFGQVVIEGMAAGVPVIAADAGGPAEILENGVTGLLTPMGDEQALSAALRLLADDPDAADRIGAAGRLQAGKCYRPELIARRLADFYSEVLAGTNRHRRKGFRRRTV